MKTETIQDPVELGVSVDTARVCTQLLSIYYGPDVRVVDLDMLTRRVIKLAKEYVLDEHTDHTWLKQELEQVCLIPYEEERTNGKR